MDAVERNGYELIPHFAFSPDLAASDFFLRGCHFRSEKKCSGLMTLEHRWSKCITLEGNYTEKEEMDPNRK